MMMFFLIMSLTISFMFLFMSHPLTIGLTLLIQTFLTCLLVGTFMKTFWFSYILFLIFMGGMLVLFIYVTSLSSNEMFSMSMKLMFMFFMMLMLNLIIFYFMDKSMIENFFYNNEMNKLSNFYYLLPENSLSLNKMYNFPTNLITLMLINYLFFTLLITVKITKKNYGPLRPMN